MLCTTKYIIFSGGFILVSDYVHMEVTLVGASWDVVAGDQAGVDFYTSCQIILPLATGLVK